MRDRIQNSPVGPGPADRQPWPRISAALALAVVATVALASAPGCDSGAEGVEACRTIQDARCEAGAPCEIIGDVAACKRFSRDNCLHGLASLDVPSTDQLNACTETIRLAGDCRAEGHTELAGCPTPPSSSTTLTLVCDVIQKPQATIECDFLNDLPPTTDGE